MQFTHPSLLKKHWRLREVPEGELQQAQEHCAEPLLAKFLLGRGLHPADISAFLEPKLKSQMPDPAGLKGMELAVARLVAAVEQRQRIVIFGDYDVDGATASAVMVRFLRMLGHDAQIYIPDRILEGYGPNTEALLKLRAEGAELVVMVDCGTVSFAPILAAKAAGLEAIVVDHHLAVEALPEAVAIINPNRLDDSFPEKQLCAAGVCFLLCVAVNRALGAKADLLALLDLVALGTVCDVMPLVGLNRVYVAQGLKVMAQQRNLGLKTLMEVAGMATETPTAYHLGFVLGPRINAGGRIGKSDLGARLLTTADAAEARTIAEELHQLNAERRTLEQLMLEEALAQAEKQANAPVLLVAKEGWHPGVIGVVAGRLKQKLERPVAVIGLKEGIGKASARSISGVDLGSAITKAREAGLLLAGGGHAMAAGFTVEEGKISALTDFLFAELEAPVNAALANRVLWLDAAVGLGGATTQLVKAMQSAAPFGQGHSEPLLLLPNVRIVQAKQVGQGHISCRLAESGFKEQSAWLKAVAFRAIGTPLEKLLQPNQIFHLAGHLKLNLWQGRETVEFHIEDAMLAA